MGRLTGPCATSELRFGHQELGHVALEIWVEPARWGDHFQDPKASYGKPDKVPEKGLGRRPLRAGEIPTQVGEDGPCTSAQSPTQAWIRN